MCFWTSGESTSRLMAQYWEYSFVTTSICLLCSHLSAISPTFPSITDESCLHAISQNSYMLHRGVLITSASGQGAPHSFRHLTSLLH